MPADMPAWGIALVLLCVAAATAALVGALLAWRRTAERATATLATVERALAEDVRPLLAELRATNTSVERALRHAEADLVRAGTLIGRAEDVADSVGRIASLAASVTRAGQIVGLVAGLKTGLDAFLHRLTRHGDDNHGQ